MRNIQEVGKKHWIGTVLVVVAGLFFYQYLYLYNYISLVSDRHDSVPTLIFNQPDEMANYAFIKEWVLHGQVGIAEPLAKLSLNQVHPRSMTVVGERLVPIGFPGFIAIVSSFLQPLIWLLGEGFFNFLVISFTPLLGALSSILLYGICRSLGLSKPVSLVAGIGLLCLPPWWYYASRPLQANTAFVFFVLAGLWAGLRKNNRVSRFFLIGLSFGLALFIRPSEWVWVFGLIGILGYLNREYLQIKQISAFGFSSGLLVLIFFLTQFAFYGSWLGSGYVKPAADGSAGLLTSGPQGIFWLKALILPFGFNALAIAKTMFYYGLKLFLPWTVAALIGFVFLMINRRQSPLLYKYTLALCVLGAWLALYYGSWQFTDNLAKQVAIGSSQVRYFLPLYVLSLPLVAYLLAIIYSWNWSGKLVAILIGFSLLISSVKSVYFKFEGLYQVNQTVHQYYEWREKMIGLTPESAIIVTRYADKYVFPDRKVIATIDTPDGVEGLLQLLRTGAQVYWYDLMIGENDPTFSDLTNNRATLDKPVASWENLELREITLIK